MIDTFRAELTAELEAFERDLAKLDARMGELDSEAYQYAEDSQARYKFLLGVRTAREHIGSAWRSVKYANDCVNGK